MSSPSPSSRSSATNERRESISINASLSRSNSVDQGNAPPTINTASSPQQKNQQQTSSQVTQNGEEAEEKNFSPIRTRVGNDETIERRVELMMLREKTTRRMMCDDEAEVWKASIMDIAIFHAIGLQELSTREVLEEFAMSNTLPRGKDGVLHPTVQEVMAEAGPQHVASTEALHRGFLTGWHLLVTDEMIARGQEGWAQRTLVEDPVSFAKSVENPAEEVRHFSIAEQEHYGWGYLLLQSTGSVATLSFHEQVSDMEKLIEAQRSQLIEEESRAFRALRSVKHQEQRLQRQREITLAREEEQRRAREAKLMLMSENRSRAEQLLEFANASFQKLRRIERQIRVETTDRENYEWEKLVEVHQPTFSCIIEEWRCRTQLEAQENMGTQQILSGIQESMRSVRIEERKRIVVDASIYSHARRLFVEHSNKGKIIRTDADNEFAEIVSAFYEELAHVPELEEEGNNQRMQVALQAAAVEIDELLEEEEDERFQITGLEYDDSVGGRSATPALSLTTSLVLQKELPPIPTNEHDARLYIKCLRREEWIELQHMDIDEGFDNEMRELRKMSRQAVVDEEASVRAMDLVDAEHSAWYETISTPFHVERLCLLEATAREALVDQWSCTNFRDFSHRAVIQHHLDRMHLNEWIPFDVKPAAEEEHVPETPPDTTAEESSDDADASDSGSVAVANEQQPDTAAPVMVEQSNEDGEQSNEDVPPLPIQPSATETETIPVVEDGRQNPQEVADEEDEEPQQRDESDPLTQREQSVTTTSNDLDTTTNSVDSMNSRKSSHTISLDSQRTPLSAAAVVRSNGFGGNYLGSFGSVNSRPFHQNGRPPAAAVSKHEGSISANLNMSQSSAWSGAPSPALFYRPKGSTSSNNIFQSGSITSLPSTKSDSSSNSSGSSVGSGMVLESNRHMAQLAGKFEYCRRSHREQSHERTKNQQVFHQRQADRHTRLEGTPISDSPLLPPPRIDSHTALTSLAPSPPQTQLQQRYPVSPLERTPSAAFMMSPPPKKPPTAQTAAGHSSHSNPRAAKFTRSNDYAAKASGDFGIGAESVEEDRSHSMPHPPEWPTAKRFESNTNTFFHSTPRMR